MPSIKPEIIEKCPHLCCGIHNIKELQEAKSQASRAGGADLSCNYSWRAVGDRSGQQALGKCSHPLRSTS